MAGQARRGEIPPLNLRPAGLKRKGGYKMKYRNLETGAIENLSIHEVNFEHSFDKLEALPDADHKMTFAEFMDQCSCPDYTWQGVYPEKEIERIGSLSVVEIAVDDDPDWEQATIQNGIVVNWGADADAEVLLVDEPHEVYIIVEFESDESPVQAHRYCQDDTLYTNMADAKEKLHEFAQAM
jgi:hypothetical protein